MTSEMWLQTPLSGVVVFLLQTSLVLLFYVQLF